MITKPDYVKLKAKIKVNNEIVVVEDFTAFKIGKEIKLQDLMVRYKDNTMRRVSAENIQPYSK